MAKALREIYQLKIVLHGSKPPIWRRFLVDSAMSLEKFHKAIQTVMGWTDSHLHQFIANGHFYGIPESELPEIKDEKKFRLNQILKEEKATLDHEYDFGDSWLHKITLEKILPYDTKQMLPLCIKAKGACPPEDIGGIWGYYEFLKALKDSDHPEHDKLQGWIGTDFDPTAYDIKRVNEYLIKRCR